MPHARGGAIETGYEFDADTRLTPAGEGRYIGVLTDRWNHWLGPDGGYVMAIAVHGLALALPFPDPLTVTAHFLGRPAFGPVEVRTEVLRAGGRHATGTAALVQDGKEILRVIGTFGDLERADGRTLVMASPPDLPPPEACDDPTAGLPDHLVTSLLHRIEARVPEVPGWLRGEPGGRPEMAFWMRFADGRPADAASLPLLADGAPPAVADLGEPGSLTLELTLHVRSRPAGSGWTAFHKRTRFLLDGYFEEDCEIWDQAGRLLGQSRQLAMLYR